MKSHLLCVSINGNEIRENVYFCFCFVLFRCALDYLSPLVAPAGLNELMESSDVVGNIRFSHPTLYVFPGGQGDAALFGINGFNMLGKCIRKAAVKIVFD